MSSTLHPGHAVQAALPCAAGGRGASRTLGAVASVLASRRAFVGLRRRLLVSGHRTQRPFFGDLFGPEEVIDPDDPGRVGVCGEYQNMPGSMVASEQSEFGWALVTRHDASEQDEFWIGDATGTVTQEWRELRLSGTSETRPGMTAGTGQSVVKVSICDGATPQMVPYCMALAYTKSLCAAALSGAHLQGAMPLDGEEMPTFRALVIGLGAGSIPVWLKHTFPKGKVIVDALEIDPAVVTVATNAMGFPKEAIRPASDAKAAAADASSGADGESMRVYSIPGEDFVDALAGLAGEDYMYDLVFIDAFDKNGKVPPVLVDASEPFLPSLNKLLAPKATLVLNLLVGMTGSGSSGGPKEIQAMVSAIHGSCCDPESSEVFTIRTPIKESSGNQIYGFLRAGRAGSKQTPLKEALKASAEAVNTDFPPDQLGQKLRFDFAGGWSSATKTGGLEMLQAPFDGFALHSSPSFAE
eukprot:CAMPEP_0197700894 /NCGR_PEP_ID=MMETSP1338-20131121/122545_1 /TAXON_ID=43686 ORGANISM="Pelagodinium beii, Strain RCC1491" /NCGR_SAMPLE_ID=MMETSP1338 /ASSEMBLY_ACC=CAM_ASM_000754 /LENGTH=468 /DNA_ID=CAMNT_0043284545 /DNA_START=140 /DNA_END=1544 /DNA_ORIENTATION=-